MIIEHKCPNCGIEFQEERRGMRFGHGGIYFGKKFIRLSATHCQIVRLLASSDDVVQYESVRNFLFKGKSPRSLTVHVCRINATFFGANVPIFISAVHNLGYGLMIGEGNLPWFDMSERSVKQ